jgi:alpha-ribazole phosphatase
VQLILVRHAEPEESARGRCYGSLDVALSEEGRAQSERLAALLAREPVARVVSSPRLRALETARPIAAAHGLEAEPLEALRELDFGRLEGRTYDEIAASEPELYARWMETPTEVRFPGGEGYADLHERVVDGVRRLRRLHAKETVVAVAHGGVVRAAVADALGLPHEHIFRLAVDTASLTRIAWLEDAPVLLRLNERVGD